VNCFSNGANGLKGKQSRRKKMFSIATATTAQAIFSRENEWFSRPENEWFTRSENEWFTRSENEW
jgi:hypothetical protein